MQVFTPYADPYKNAKCLDPRRRNKQILEIIQIICANNDIDIGWKIPKYIKNHPNTIKWKECDEYLLFYCFCLLHIFFTNKNKIHKAYFAYEQIVCWLFTHYSFKKIHKKIPTWFTKETCYEHRNKLLEKYPEYYKNIF